MMQEEEEEVCVKAAGDGLADEGDDLSSESEDENERSNSGNGMDATAAAGEEHRAACLPATLAMWLTRSLTHS